MNPETTNVDCGRLLPPTSAKLASRRAGQYLAFIVLAILPVLLGACASGPQIRDRRIVVLNFESAQNPAKGQAVADWVKNSLANYPRVALLETRTIEPYLTSTQNSTNYLQAAGRKAGLDYLVLGSYAQLDKNYIVNARLLAVSTGEIVKGSSVSRACEREEDLYPVAQAIARVLAANIKYLAEQYDAQARTAAAR